MREAEAELNRARLLAIQKVVSQQHTIETLATAVKTAEAGYQAAEANLRFAQAQSARAEQLFKRGGIAVEDRDAAQAKLEQAKANLEAAKAALQAAKADVAKAQAELPYLLGKGNKDDKTNAAEVQDLVRFMTAYRNQGDATKDAALALAWLAKNQPQGKVADKLRKALDKTISLNFTDDTDFGTILDQLQEAAGVPMVTTLPRSYKVRGIIVKDVPLAAAFQCVEDVAQVQFGVRDYGILAANKLSSGVTRLSDFWKAPPEKPKPAPEKSKSSQRNPPPRDVEGKVSAIDAAAGLMEISVGSNNGLLTGHTLEVYRTNDGKGGAKYLGTLRIEQTEPDRSVGKVLNKLNAPVEVGDRVSNKFFVD